MGINLQLLREKIKAANIQPEQLAERIGMNRATYYRKMKAGGIKFTIGEIQALMQTLELSREEAAIIFFADEVA